LRHRFHDAAADEIVAEKRAFFCGLLKLATADILGARRAGARKRPQPLGKVQPSTEAPPGGAQQQPRAVNSTPIVSRIAKPVRLNTAIRNPSSRMRPSRHVNGSGGSDDVSPVTLSAEGGAVKMESYSVSGTLTQSVGSAI
jgi:hypothetical protein